jgi:hypothetical protein
MNLVPVLILCNIYIQDVAEMVEHFKILVTCFSARLSRSGVFEHKQ